MSDPSDGGRLSRSCAIDEQIDRDDRPVPRTGASGGTVGDATGTAGRTRSVAVLAAVVIVGLGGLAVLVGGRDDGPSGEAIEVADAVEVRGEPLPRHPGDQQPDPAGGRSAPTLEGVDVDGEPVTIEPGDGPMAVIFLAHWCPHCQRKVPQVQAMLDQGRLPDEVEIVSVSTGVAPDRDNYPPSAWFDQVGWTPPVLIDDADRSAATSYGLSGFPFTVFIGSDGAVLGRIAGAVEPDVFAGIMEELAGR